MVDDLTRDQKEAERAAEEQAAVIAVALALALLSLRPRMSVVMWWLPGTWADFADDVAKAIAPASKAHDRAARAVWLGYDPLDEATVAAEAAAREKVIRDIVDSTRRAVEKVVAWGQMNGITGDDLSAILEKVAGINANQAGPILAWFEKRLDEGGPTSIWATVEKMADKALKERSKTLTGDLLWDAVQAGRMAAGKQEQRATNAMVTKTWRTAEDEHVCFPEWVTVSTPDGQARISSLKAGDAVLTRGGHHKVVETIATKYSGDLTIIATAGGAILLGTANHPVWCDGRWVRMSEIAANGRVELGGDKSDAVICVLNFSFADANDQPSLGCEESILPHILGWVLVPVGSINLNGDPHRRDAEVNGIPAAPLLAGEGDAKRLKCFPHGSFKGRLDIGAAITGEGAELPIGVGRLLSDRCPTGGARNDSRGASALLGAVGSVEMLLGSERRAASFARDILGGCEPALSAANIEPVSNGRPYGEVMAANAAMLDGHDCGIGRYAAFGGTELLSSGGPGLGDIERNATMGAYAGSSGLSRRMVTVCGAVDVPSLRDLLLNCFGAALGAGVDEWHVDQSAGSVAEMAKNGSITVYNMAVSCESEYFANGVLVHNCNVCGPLHGVTVPIDQPFPGGFMMPKAHSLCRCHTEITVSEEGMF